MSEVLEDFKMTELGPLPKEWEVVKIGEVFDVQQGKQLSEKETKEGKIKKLFLRTSNLGWGYINTSSVDKMYFTPAEFEKLRLKKGDILVCEGGDIGRTALYRGELEECAYQNHLHRLRPKKENIDPEFFVFWMNHAINQRKLYTYTANRTTIPNLSSSRLKNFITPLPPPPEQKKIAAVLSSVQSAKEKTEDVIKATKELKKSLMKHLFTYGPVPVEEAENVPLKETEIGLMPEEWEVVRLGEVCETKTGGTPSRQQPGYYKGDIPWVKSGELEDNFIYYTEENVTQSGLKNSSAKIFPAGTLLIALYSATVGKTAILKIDAATNQAICGIFPKDKSVLTEFIRDYLIFTRPKLLEERYGGAQPNISQTIIRNTKLSLPPLPEQKKIAEILTSVDRKIEAEENKKKALEDLFKTLLHDLMTAKIRVNDLNLGGEK